MRDIAREARMFFGPRHMDMSVVDAQQEPTYNTSVQTLDVVWKTFLEQWMIETNGKIESVLATKLDDDDDDDDDDIINHIKSSY